MATTYQATSLPHPAATLGVIPSAEGISSLATFQTSGTSVTFASTPVVSPSAASPANVASLPAEYPLIQAATASVGKGQGLVISSALPPVPAKLVAKIQAGQFLQMKDLLGDIALHSQLDNLPASSLGGHFPGTSHPQMREVSSALSWAGPQVSHSMDRWH